MHFRWPGTYDAPLGASEDALGTAPRGHHLIAGRRVAFPGSLEVISNAGPRRPASWRDIGISEPLYLQRAGSATPLTRGDQMGEESSGPDPVASHDADGSEVTQPMVRPVPATRRQFPVPDDPPPHPPTQVSWPYQPPDTVPPHPPTQAASPYQSTNTIPPRSLPEIMRYGPGVPAAAQARQVAERAWRAGATATPARRPRRLRRLLGSALTVILLAACGVLLYLRFHHAPFHVTGVAITQPTRFTCGVNVTGRISTNGAAGTVSYQWVITPGREPPQPLNSSVIAGQHAAYVTDTLSGSGWGGAPETVTLQVLGPDLQTASTTVVVRC